MNLANARFQGLWAGLRISALAALLFILSGVVAPARAIIYPALFSTQEFRSDNLEIFPKWTGALDRYFDEKRLGDGECTGEEFNRCYLGEWQSFLNTLVGLDRRSQIEKINRYMNEAWYITDIRNYGVLDYWATPRQFFTRDGDCEDYAIAKFMSLRALGLGNELMRVVVLQDLNLQTAHAVLVVYLDGEALILDNQVLQVVPADQIRHYQPYYSLNETSWWLHQPL